MIYKSFTDTPFGGTVYPNKGAAKLNVEGVVNAIGGIAGEVHGINGGKVIIGNKAILSITEKRAIAEVQSLGRRLSEQANL